MFFNSVEVFDAETSNVIFLGVEECAFGYRDSIFKKELKGKAIITSVTFRLNIDPVFSLDYERNVAPGRGGARERKEENRVLSGDGAAAIGTEVAEPAGMVAASASAGVTPDRY